MGCGEPNHNPHPPPMVFGQPNHPVSSRRIAVRGPQPQPQHHTEVQSRRSAHHAATGSPSPRSVRKVGQNLHTAPHLHQSPGASTQSGFTMAWSIPARHMQTEDSQAGQKQWGFATASGSPCHHNKANPNQMLRPRFHTYGLPHRTPVRTRNRNTPFPGWWHTIRNGTCRSGSTMQRHPGYWHTEVTNVRPYF